MELTRPSLWKWYIEEKSDGKLWAHGVVSGHLKVINHTLIHTSTVISIETLIEKNKAIITTRNTVYDCKLSDCRFDKQDTYPNAIENYNIIKEKYNIPEIKPDIEQNKILLLLSNYDKFFFHSLIINSTGELEEYGGNAHIGMFQDSYLVHTEDFRIDIRYFLGNRLIKFYSLKTEDMPLYIENIGSCDLMIQGESLEYTLKSKMKILFEDSILKDKPTVGVLSFPESDIYRN